MCYECASTLFIMAADKVVTLWSANSYLIICLRFNFAVPLNRLGNYWPCSNRQCCKAKEKLNR